MENWKRGSPPEVAELLFHSAQFTEVSAKAEHGSAALHVAAYGADTARLPS